MAEPVENVARKLRFLFVVQGEGRGHMTQAIALKQLLTEAGHEICMVLVGKSSTRAVPSFFNQKMGMRHLAFPSPNFLQDKAGKGILIGRSIISNLLKARRFFNSIAMIRSVVERQQPDAIINFYEPLMGLYALASKHHPPIISIAHQYVYLHPGFHFPAGGALQQAALVNFTKITAAGSALKLALSMYAIQPAVAGISVVPPILRQELFKLKAQAGDYYLVYLLNSGYIDEIMSFHRLNPKVKLHCFTDRKEIEDEMVIDDSLTFHRLSDEKFLKLMAGAKGLVSTAGFESVCEAMYLSKPVLMVPVAGHWEQFSNSRDAAKAGAGIFDDSFKIDRLMDYVYDADRQEAYREWVNSANSLILAQIVGILGQKPKGTTKTPALHSSAMA